MNSKTVNLVQKVRYKEIIHRWQDKRDGQDQKT